MPVPVIPIAAALGAGAVGAAVFIVRRFRRRREGSNARPTSSGRSPSTEPSASVLDTVKSTAGWEGYPRCRHHGCKDEQGRWPEGRNLYVIRLHDSVWKRTKFKNKNPHYFEYDNPCVYVGETAHQPACRLEQHLNGYKSSWWAKTYGQRLMPDAYQHLNPVPKDTDAAKKAEERLGRRLQRRGWAVWGPDEL